MPLKTFQPLLRYPLLKNVFRGPPGAVLPPQMKLFWSPNPPPLPPTEQNL